VLEADNISYAYHGAEELALDHLSARFAPGQLVALAGPNGSGRNRCAVSAGRRW